MTMGQIPSFVCFFLFVCLALSSEGRDDDFKIVGYIPEYRLHAISWESVGPILTHAILFSLEPTANGGIQATDRLPNEENMKAIQEAREQYGVKVLLGFGGNGRSEHFAAMTTNANARKAFVHNVVKFVEELQLDGVDYNWEYPGFTFRGGYSSPKVIKNEFSGLRMLVKDTKDAFQKTSRPLEVTIAYYPDGQQERYLKSHGVMNYVDLAHAMAYDQGRRDHSPITLVPTVIKYARTQRLPLEKITVGLPFYGRDEKTGHARSYEEILEIDPAGASFRETNVIYRFGRDQAMTYNGPDMIEKKTQMAIEAGIAGVMIWELGQDCRMKEVSRGGQTHPQTCPQIGNSLLYAIKTGKNEYIANQKRKERELQMAIEVEKKLGMAKDEL